MKKRFLQTCAFVLLTGAVWAQSGTTITVDPAGENVRVNLAQFDAGMQASFATLFQIPEYEDRKPFSLLLTNSTGQPIVGLTICWTVNSGERTGIYQERIDIFGQLAGGGVRSSVPMPGQSSAGPATLGESYTSAQGMVLGAGERLLVAPGLFVRESVARERGRPESSSGMPESIRTATAISVSVDTVILQDGTVLGPDVSRTVDAILQRKAEVGALQEAVQKMEASGQDGAYALREIANSRLSPQRGGPSLGQRSLARRLMVSPDWKAQLQRIAATQLPAFHR